MDAASGLLNQFQSVATSAKEAEQKAHDIDRRKKDAAKLENSFGSTGGRLEQLNEQIRKMQADLSKDLSTVDQKIDQALRDQGKGS